MLWRLDGHVKLTWDAKQQGTDAARFIAFVVVTQGRVTVSLGLGSRKHKTLAMQPQSIIFSVDSPSDGPGSQWQDGWLYVEQLRKDRLEHQSAFVHTQAVKQYHLTSALHTYTQLQQSRGPGEGEIDSLLGRSAGAPVRMSLTR